MAWTDYDNDVGMAVMYGVPGEPETWRQPAMTGLGAIPWWYIPGIGIPGIPFLGLGECRPGYHEATNPSGRRYCAADASGGSTVPLIDVSKLRTPQLNVKLNLVRSGLLVRPGGTGGSTTGRSGFGPMPTPESLAAGEGVPITPADAEQLAKGGQYEPPGGTPPPAEDVDLAHGKGFGHEDEQPPIEEEEPPIEEEELSFWDEHGSKVMIGGAVVAGVGLIAALTYWLGTRKTPKAPARRGGRKLKRKSVLRRNAAPVYYVQCQGPRGFEEWSESRTLSQAKAKAAKALHLTGQPCRIIEASGWRTRLVGEVR